MNSGSLHQQPGSIYSGQQFPIGSQSYGLQPSIQQFQQVLSQLEQAEARHAQMLQQIQADEQFAAHQLQQLRTHIAHLAQGTQLQHQQPISAFPRV